MEDDMEALNDLEAERPWPCGPQQSLGRVFRRPDVVIVGLETEYLIAARLRLKLAALPLPVVIHDETGSIGKSFQPDGLDLF